jgi:hypothetical protein
MPLMQEKLYHALMAVGASDDVAREAAVEAVEKQDRIDSRLAKLEADVKVLKWMMGTMIVLQISTFFMMFQIYAKVH